MPILVEPQTGSKLLNNVLIKTSHSLSIDPVGGSTNIGRGI